MAFQQVLFLSCFLAVVGKTNAQDCSNGFTPDPTTCSCYKAVTGTRQRLALRACDDVIVGGADREDFFAGVAALGGAVNYWTDADRTNGEYRFNDGDGALVRDANGDEVETVSGRECVAYLATTGEYTAERCGNDLVNNAICKEGNTMPGTWQSWNSFGECTGDCTSATSTRTRMCSSGCCIGISSETEECSSLLLNQYVAWTPFDTCSTSCGVGTQTRTRDCATVCCDPMQESETRDCMGVEPLGEWGPWTVVAGAMCLDDLGGTVTDCTGGGGTIAEERSGTVLACESSLVGEDARNMPCFEPVTVDDFTEWTECLFSDVDTSTSPATGFRYRFGMCSDPSGECCDAAAEIQKQCCIQATTAAFPASDFVSQNILLRAAADGNSYTVSFSFFETAAMDFIDINGVRFSGFDLPDPVTLAADEDLDVFLNIASVVPEGRGVIMNVIYSGLLGATDECPAASTSPLEGAVL